MTYNPTEAELRLKLRKDAFADITKVISRGIHSSATPMEDITRNFKEANRAAIADALEQFTMDELADFLIEIGEGITEHHEERPDVDELESYAADLRYLANDLEDAAKRYRRGQR